MGEHKFRVGDRVRLLSDEDEYRPAGSIGIVRDTPSDNYLTVDFEKPFDGWGDTNSWNISPRLIEPAPLFAVGDKVRVVKTPDNGGYGAIGDIGIISSVYEQSALLKFETGEEAGGTWSISVDDLEPVAVAPQPQPLRIEAGRYYKTRDGRKVGPMKPWTSGSADYQWESEGYLWKDDGENYDKDSAHTIVAEWTGEPATDDWYFGKTKPTSTTGFTVPMDAPEFGGGFKVGDRVNTVYCVPTDNPGTVTAVVGGEVFVRWDKYYSGMYTKFRESELRLVAEATSGKDDEPDAKLLVTISADTSALDAEIDRVLKRLRKLKRKAKKLGINLEYGELREAA